MAIQMQCTNNDLELWYLP